MSQPMETTMVMGSELREAPAKGEYYQVQSGDRIVGQCPTQRAHDDIRVGDVFECTNPSMGPMGHRTVESVSDDNRVTMRGFDESTIISNAAVITAALARGDYVRVEPVLTMDWDARLREIAGPNSKWRRGAHDKKQMVAFIDCAWAIPSRRYLEHCAPRDVQLYRARRDAYPKIAALVDERNGCLEPVEQAKPRTPAPEPTQPPFKVGDRVRVGVPRRTIAPHTLDHLRGKFGVIVRSAVPERCDWNVDFGDGGRYFDSCELEHATTPSWPEGVTIHDDYDAYGERLWTVLRGSTPIGRMWLHRARVIDGDDVVRRDDTDMTYVRAIMFMSSDNRIVGAVTVEHFCGLDTVEAIDRARDGAVAALLEKGLPKRG